MIYFSAYENFSVVNYIEWPIGPFRVWYKDKTVKLNSHEIAKSS